MAQRPNLPCRVRTCPNYSVERGYCRQHVADHPAKSTAEYDKNRPTATGRGYGATWRKTRQLVLHRDPFCRHCQRAASTEVDHIVPKRDGGQDTEDNLQGLCKPCHSRKTATEPGNWRT